MVAVWWWCGLGRVRLFLDRPFGESIFLELDDGSGDGDERDTARDARDDRAPAFEDGLRFSDAHALRGVPDALGARPRHNLDQMLAPLCLNVLKLELLLQSLAAQLYIPDRELLHRREGDGGYGSSFLLHLLSETESVRLSTSLSATRAAGCS